MRTGKDFMNMGLLCLIIMAAAAIGGTADYRDAVRTQDEAAQCETTRCDTAESAFDVIRSVERAEQERTQ